MSATTVSLLKKFDAFEEVPDSEQEALATHFGTAAYSHGQLILGEETDPTHLFFINSGRVQIFKTFPGSVNFLTILEGGDIFGEVAFIDHGERSAGASAIGEVSVLFLTRDELEKMIETQPKTSALFLTGLMKSLTRKFRAVCRGMDMKSPENALLDLITTGQMVKVSLSNGVEYICRIKYADTRTHAPLLRVDSKGREIYLPFNQVQSISLPDSFGHF